MRPIILSILFIMAVGTPLVLAWDKASIDVDRLATAIWRAEGGNKTRHPYGILAKYKTTTPRQACINTIKSGLRRYKTYKGKDDFIVFLSKTYCPVGSDTDNGTCQYWSKNVKYFYTK